MDFTEADVASLGVKLDGLELTDGERAALVAVFATADPDDVSGFAYDLNPNQVSFSSLLAGGWPFDPAQGRGRPADPFGSAAKSIER